MISYYNYLIILDNKTIFICVILILMAVIFSGLAIIQKANGLNIKARRVGDGQHGNARWLSKKGMEKVFLQVPYTPEKWRKDPSSRPDPQMRGVILAQKQNFFTEEMIAYVDTADIHFAVEAATGAGKTTFLLYPNIEYCMACGMSFVNTDTKGDVYRNCGYVGEHYYGYKNILIDFRNPTKSHGNNILSNVNKYMDIYKADPKNLTAKAKTEKFAKIIAASIMNADSSTNYGANSFFYDAAEGLISSVILLVSEFGEEEERHIPSVFSLLTELLEMIDVPGSSARTPGTRQVLAFSELIQKLPPQHKARLYAMAAISGADKGSSSSVSVVTTALSKLNRFIDSEVEQILCFDNDIDVEKFCSEKTALYIVLPEEDQTKHFMISLIIQQFYQEVLVCADSRGGKLTDRVMLYGDEIGTIPKIAGLEMMFSAARSRDFLMMILIQGMSQFKAKYGDDNAKTIADNIGCAIYGGFAPKAEINAEVSKALGTYTVKTASVSSDAAGKGSVTYSMTSKPLISEQELQNKPKGFFIVKRENVDPFVSKMKFFKEWGITFPGRYELPDKSTREVKYLSAVDLFLRVQAKYSHEVNARQSLSFLLSKHTQEPNTFTENISYAQNIKRQRRSQASLNSTKTFPQNEAKFDENELLESESIFVGPDELTDISEYDLSDMLNNEKTKEGSMTEKSFTPLKAKTNFH